MTEKIIIRCPWHATEEEITIPDAYLGVAYSRDEAVIFEGDIPCNPKNPEHENRILHMKIHFQGGKATWVEKITIVKGAL